MADYSTRTKRVLRRRLREQLGFALRVGMTVQERDYRGMTFPGQMVPRSHLWRVTRRTRRYLTLQYWKAE